MHEAISYPLPASTGGASLRLCGPIDVPYAATMEDDASFMQRYAEAGDTAAFEQLYHRHKDAVYRYVLRQTGDAEAAEDVFQETWIRLIRARERYTPSARFRTYLFHIARNCFVDYLRRSRRHSQHDSVDDHEPLSADRPLEQYIDSSARHRDILAAIGRLPTEQRDAFLLHEEAGLSVTEIARVTGVNPETAKSRIRYAVQKLKAAVAAEGNEL